MDPLDAQATDGITETNDTAEPQGGVPSGLQARIDELTGQFRNMERSNMEKDQQILQLTNRLLERDRGPQVDPLDAVLKDVDPDDMRRVSAIMQKQMAPLLQRLDQLTGELHQTRANSALAGVEDPAVRKKAQELIDGWKRKGVFGSIATEQDAIYMAKGILGDTQTRAASEREAFNRGEPALTGVRATPTTSSRRQKGPDLSGLDADGVADRLRQNPELADQFEFDL